MMDKDELLRELRTRLAKTQNEAVVTKTIMMFMFEMLVDIRDAILLALGAAEEVQHGEGDDESTVEKTTDRDET